MKFTKITKLIGISGIFYGCNGQLGPDGSKQNHPSPLGLTSYSSCSEIQNDVRSALIVQREYSKANSPDKRVSMPASAQESQADTKDSSSGSPSAKSSASTSSQSPTNVQVQGVDEADFVKVGANHIYVSRKNMIEVIDRKSLKPVGTLKWPIDSGSISGYSNAPAKSLYAQDQTLVLMGTSNKTIKYCEIPQPQTIPTKCDDGPLGAGVALTCTKTSNPACISRNISATTIQYYTAEEGQMPKLALSREYTGKLADTRLTNGNLVLVFQEELQIGNESEKSATTTNPVYSFESDVSKIGGIPCSQITKPPVADIDFGLTKVISLSLKDYAFESSIGLLGVGDMVYMNAKNLYLAKNGTRWMPRGQNQTANGTFLDQDRAQITKISLLPNGTVVPMATGRVFGRIQDRWAFNEFQETGVLSVITTSLTASETMPEPNHIPSVNGNRAQIGDPITTSAMNKFHHLWILSQEGLSLEKTYELHKFGDGEDIRAVRYLGCMGYVVTFRAVDPLFAFDFSDSRQPKITSELKIDGFSAYLHPVDHGRLLGVGYATKIPVNSSQWAMPDGVQVSLFDTSNPQSLSRLDVKILGGAGSRSLLVPDAHANVVIDAHAFYFDPDKKLIGLPVELAGPNGNGGQNFAGAVLFKYEDSKITEFSRISHRTLLSQGNSNPMGIMPANGAYGSKDIARIFSLDDRLLSFSMVGMVHHSWSNPQEMLEFVKFKDIFSEEDPSGNALTAK
jgi:uncharacterized secreted protein with C-terminal beta-propeller domain